MPRKSVVHAEPIPAGTAPPAPVPPWPIFHCLPSEIEAPDALVGPDRLARALEPVEPELEDVRVVRDLERLRRVLLDHQDGLAATPEIPDDPEDLLEDERGQAQGRLIEEHEPRPEQEGAAHLQHLLLAA